MRILQDFLAFLLMRVIGRSVRRFVRLLFAILLVGGGGGYALYRSGCHQLEDEASAVCRATALRWGRRSSCCPVPAIVVVSKEAVSTARTAWFRVSAT